ncbi:hypothetical protein LJB99_01060 [Deltaproteobacteria bacterium OttesenSCG-928-K17]|nr:hypothetical protein [Deltaproteobacteria bacterium OttesenSCG-928-K17]
MKVSSEHLQQLLGATQKRTQDTAGTSGGESFAEILKQSETRPAENSAASATAPSRLEPSGMIGMILAGQKTADKESAPDQQIQSALDQMEAYAEALADGEKSLKDISPLADSLKQAANQLNELSQRLADGHPLKGLSQEAAVLATVESMKFSRGDYI